MVTVSPTLPLPDLAPGPGAVPGRPRWQPRIDRRGIGCPGPPRRGRCPWPVRGDRRRGWPVMRAWVARHPVTAFVALAYALTWSVWLPLLGSLGPAAAAVVVIAATRGRAGLAELGRRLTAWRGRWRGRAWAFALGVPPLLLLVAASAAALVDGQSPADLGWAAFGRSAEFAALPVAVYWLAGLVFFGFG